MHGRRWGAAFADDREDSALPTSTVVSLDRDFPIPSAVRISDSQVRRSRSRADFLATATSTSTTVSASVGVGDGDLVPGRGGAPGGLTLGGAGQSATSTHTRMPVRIRKMFPS